MVAVSGVLGMALAPSGCAPGSMGGSDGPTRAGADTPNPFAPASVRAHPLTHLDRDDEGKPIIVLHAELRDRWGEPCKGAGTLVVELYRPSSGPASGLETQELVWEVDLSDLDLNVRLYDPATRTYRLQLSDLPGWITVGDQEGADRRVRLNVVLTTTGPQGVQVVLEDAYVLRY